MTTADDVVDGEFTEQTPQKEEYKSADHEWILEKCKNLMPNYKDKPDGYVEVLEFLVLELRNRLAMNIDRSMELVNIAEHIKSSLRGGW